MKPLTPFTPPPTFQTNGNKMPPISLKKSVVNRLGSTPALGGLTPSVTGFTGRSTLGLAANNHHARTVLRSHQQRPTKMSFTSAEVSPSASCESSVLSNGMSMARSKVASSTSSSTGTLTAGSGGDSITSKPTDGVLKKDPKSNCRRSHLESSFVSEGGGGGGGDESRTPKSSNGTNTSQLSSLKPVSRNSSPSNASTLTPSPTTTPKADKPPESTASCSKVAPPAETSPLPEDIGRVLQQLSLERYHPIFEEQEVDMEAFLTLTDSDLLELGISNDESRHQILTSINELNLNKDRERQQYQQAISNFNSTLRPQEPFNSGNSQILDFGEWTEEGAVDQQ